MTAPTSIRIPDELRARIEGARLGREKFSATVLRLVEEALDTPPSAEQAAAYATLIRSGGVVQSVDEDGIRSAAGAPAPQIPDLPRFSAPRGGVEFRGPDPKPARDPGKKRRY